MLPPRLQKGDTIGLAAPCWLATADWARSVSAALEQTGYRVKWADHLCASGWTYAASREERISDLNQLIHDADVRMIFFGGGEGAEDVLDDLDYAAAAASPKIWLSYSDGTSILNAVHQQTGLITYYGQMPGLMPARTTYDTQQFELHLTHLGIAHVPAATWHTICPGRAEGTMIGGYLGNLLLMARSGEVGTPDTPYILFLEDHERFNGIEALSARIGQLERAPIMRQVTGILFGHYSSPVNAHLLERLARLGKRWGIPIAYCDDFGHGAHHAILPIGAHATLDTAAHTLHYHW